MLHVAAAHDRVLDVLERCVALDLELPVRARRHGGRSDTPERARERLQVAARRGRGRCGSRCGTRRRRRCGRTGTGGDTCRGRSRTGGVACGGRCAGRVAGTLDDDVALVIERRDAREVGLDVEHGVERIGDDARLGRCRSGRSVLGLGTQSLRGGVGATRVGQAVADELSDDERVLRRVVRVRGLVGRFKRGLHAAVETRGEVELGSGTRTEVGRAVRTGGGRRRCGIRRGGGGCSSGSRRRCAGACDGTALVVDRSDILEVGCEAEDRIEEVGLLARLGRAAVGRRLRLLARILGSLIRTALVCQGVANELGDNADGLCGGVVVRLEIDGLKRRLLAVVEADSELDLGNGA